MKMKSYDVTGFGSALLDITYEIPDSILDELGLKKANMHLIDKEKSNLILDRLKGFDSKSSPGGSVANTISGLSSLGGKGIFFAKLGKDSHADVYEKNTASDGVIGIFSKHHIEKTGHSIILITPDKERTFATHLGAALSFNEQDLDFNYIKDSKILHLEAYLFDILETKNALPIITRFTKENNVKISLDLSDSNLIKRNFDSIRDFVKNHVDIVFANESEAMAFTEKNDPESALHELAKLCNIAVVKTGKTGSMIKSNGSLIKIPPYKADVINTNGAGDSYASGFLYGLANDFSLEKSGHLASFIASLVVASESARMNKSDLEKINKFYFTKIL